MFDGISLPTLHVIASYKAKNEHCIECGYIILKPSLGHLAPSFRDLDKLVKRLMSQYRQVMMTNHLPIQNGTDGNYEGKNTGQEWSITDDLSIKQTFSQHYTSMNRARS